MALKSWKLTTILWLVSHLQLYCDWQENYTMMYFQAENQENQEN